MDQGPLGMLHAVVYRVDIAFTALARAVTITLSRPFCDLFHRFEVAGRRSREPGLYDVHVKLFKLGRDLQFFIQVQFRAGNLFAVP